MSQRISFTGKLQELLTAASMAANSMKELVQNASLGVVGSAFRSDILNYMSQYAFLLREIKDNLVQAGLVPPRMGMPSPETYKNLLKLKEPLEKFISETTAGGKGHIARYLEFFREQAQYWGERASQATNVAEEMRYRARQMRMQDLASKTAAEFNEWIESAKKFFGEETIEELIKGKSPVEQYEAIMGFAREKLGKTKELMDAMFKSPLKTGVKAVLGEVFHPLKEGLFLLRHPKYAAYKTLFSMARGIASFRESAKYWAGLNIKMVALYILLAPLTQALSGLLKVFQPLMVVFQALGTIVGLAIMPVIMEITKFVLVLIEKLAEWLPTAQEFMMNLFKIFGSLFYGLMSLAQGGDFWSGFVGALREGLAAILDTFLTTNRDIIIGHFVTILTTVLTSEQVLEAFQEIARASSEAASKEFTKTTGKDWIRAIIEAWKLVNPAAHATYSLIRLFHPEEGNEA